MLHAWSQSDVDAFLAELSPQGGALPVDEIPVPDSGKVDAGRIHRHEVSEADPCRAILKTQRCKVLARDAACMGGSRSGIVSERLARKSHQYCRRKDQAVQRL